MYTFIVENESGEQLRLTQNDKYVIESITGLNPPSTSLNYSTLVNNDGSDYNSGRIENRNIVIQVYPKFPVEENRLRLYRIFKLKKTVKIFYKNGSRNVYIEGQVESVEVSPFVSPQLVQISIICPKPHWLSVGEVVTDVSKEVTLFEFPFSIDAEGIPFSEYNDAQIAAVINHGDVESGMIIDIHNNGGGTFSIPRIYNADTGEFFEVAASTSNVAVSIRIDTEKKKVYFLENDLTPAGDLFNYVNVNSKWLTVAPGTNFFYYTASEGAANMTVTFRFKSKYEGV